MQKKSLMIASDECSYFDELLKYTDAGPCVQCLIHRGQCRKVLHRADKQQHVALKIDQTD